MFLAKENKMGEKVQGNAAGERIGELIIESHGVDKYGRCLGTLFIGACNINQQLLLEGRAEEY
jgi:endonuclease YncB( thermonuclease family)